MFKERKPVSLVSGQPIQHYVPQSPYPPPQQPPQKKGMGTAMVVVLIVVVMVIIGIIAVAVMLTL
ncbi:MAG: hypothetical protein GWN12_20835, partial [Thermoplasmata archaeon]|nr:hypothetical protein [Thermoplasmata archaeon]NIS14453.1 hypothetical protein [Thermoplasmata archaeon]NIW91153.1 hypothetical protein [Thermoplasmata archaeon]